MEALISDCSPWAILGLQAHYTRVNAPVMHLEGEGTFSWGSTPPCYPLYHKQNTCERTCIWLQMTNTSHPVEPVVLSSTIRLGARLSFWLHNYLWFQLSQRTLCPSMVHGLTQRAEMPSAGSAADSTLDAIIDA